MQCSMFYILFISHCPFPGILQFLVKRGNESCKTICFLTPLIFQYLLCVLELLIVIIRICVPEGINYLSFYLSIFLYIPECLSPDVISKTSLPTTMG